MNHAVPIGIVSAVFLKLFASELPEFDENELLVIEAIRRSNNDLNDASIEEIADYVQTKDPSQLDGLQNNVKGIYHELSYVNSENSDGDEYTAQLFTETNHPGADIILTNTLTGEVTEIQLKATDYLSYVQKHNEKYEDIAVFATEEVASKSDDIASSGFSNSQLEEDVEGVLKDLDKYGDSAVLSSMTVAAMLSLAKNTKLLLRGQSMDRQDKKKLAEEGALAAGVAGVVSLIIG